jgi:hypothetical protein
MPGHELIVLFNSFVIISFTFVGEGQCNMRLGSGLISIAFSNSLIARHISLVG